MFSYNVTPSEFMFRIFPINGMLVNLGPGGIPLSSYSSVSCFMINTNSTARRTLPIVMLLTKVVNKDAILIEYFYCYHRPPKLSVGGKVFISPKLWRKKHQTTFKP